jgi:hypothetical protein
MDRPSHPPVPHIAVFDKTRNSSIALELGALIAAMQKFVDEHLAPVWGTPARLVRSHGFLPGHWAIVFLDEYRDATLEGFHDLTPDGLPMSKVYVLNVLRQKDQVSVAVSHELAEMLVDPAANLYTTGPRPNRLYDYEVADPVEELFFHIDGIAMSNFVYPAYFENFHKPGSVRFDHMGKLKRPFELHSGGYQSYWSEGQERTAWGSKAKKARFEEEDRRGHRSELHRKRNRKPSRSRKAVPASAS